MILAAGAGTRLGTCKALVDLDPTAARPIIPLRELISSGRGLAPVQSVIVTGADHAAIERAAPAGTALLHNPEWSAGRTGGVLLASRALAGIDLCLAPVDVPLVTRVVFEELRRSWCSAGSPPRGWLAPAFVRSAEAAGFAGSTESTGSPESRGERVRYGHPVIVGRELLRCLSDEDRALPLRELRARADPLWSVDVADPAILDDLDTPRDLARIRARLARD